MPAPKMTRIHPALDLDPVDVRRICENAIERVLNTAIAVVDAAPEDLDPRVRELADTNLQDLRELKELVCRLWDKARDELIRERCSPVPAVLRLEHALREGVDRGRDDEDQEQPDPGHYG